MTFSRSRSSKSEKASYSKKLKQLGFGQDHDDPLLAHESKKALEQWSTSRESWPKVHFGNVYMYLIDCPGYDHSSLKEYKSLEAYHYFDKGYVHQLCIWHSKTGHCIIQGCVNRSKDVFAKPYKAWVGLRSRDGSIITGHCTCMTDSASICAHVVAIIFLIEAFSHEGFRENSCAHNCTKQTLTQPEENVPSASVDIKESKECLASREVGKTHGHNLRDRTFKRKNFLNVGTPKKKMKTETKNPKALPEGRRDETDVDKLKKWRGTCCVALNCSNKQLKRSAVDAFGRNGDVTFHHFPTKSELHAQWIAATKRENFKPSSASRLCSAHFKETDFTIKSKFRRCLKPTAVPSIFQLPAQLQIVGTLPEETVCKVEVKSELSHGDGSETTLAESNTYKQENVASQNIVLNPGEAYAATLSTHNVLENHTEEQHSEGSLENIGLTEVPSSVSFEGQEKQQPREESLKNVDILDVSSCVSVEGQEKQQPREESLKNIDILEVSSCVSIDGQEKHQPSEESLKNVDILDVSSCVSVEGQEKHQPSEECLKNVDILDVSSCVSIEGQEKHQPSEECLKNIDILEVSSCVSVEGQEKHQPSEECLKNIDILDVSSCVSVEGQEKHHPREECLTVVGNSAEPLNLFLASQPPACAYTIIVKTADGIPIPLVEKGGLPSQTCNVDPAASEEFGNSESTIFSRVKHLENQSVKHLENQSVKHLENQSVKHLENQSVKHLENQSVKHLENQSVKHLENQSEEKLQQLKEQKPHQCDQCDKSFKKPSDLKRHRTTHSIERPFQCKECSKSFKLQSCLQNHMKYHGESHFKCSECEKSFKVVEQLNRHMKTHSGDKPYECTQCDKKYSERHHLIRHMICHTREKPFECHECGKHFASNSSLRQHLKSHTVSGKPSLKCRICDEAFGYYHSLQEHMKSHAEDSMFKCNQCGKLFREHRFLTRHIRRHTEVKTFQCGECDKKYSERRWLLNHMKCHSGDWKDYEGESQQQQYQCQDEKVRRSQEYMCHECGKIFSKKSVLQSHLLTHSGEKPYKCKLCTKSFTRNAYLLKHIRVHSGEKPFLCTMCGRAFSERESLRHHVRIHTGEKPFTCEECGKSFRTPSMRYNHMKIHTAQKLYAKYKCTVCNMIFEDKTSLSDHMKSQLGDGLHAENSQAYSILKPFTCNVCGKGFTTSLTRNIHQKRHTEETKFKCTECGKSFVCKAALQSHTFIHTGQKPFQCTVCGRSFRIRANVARHMNVHLGIRPYKCPICHKSFSQYVSVSVHMRTHTGEKPYKCDECGQAYSEKRGLLKHMQKSHS